MSKHSSLDLLSNKPNSLPGSPILNRSPVRGYGTPPGTPKSGRVKVFGAALTQPAENQNQAFVELTHKDALDRLDADIVHLLSTASPDTNSEEVEKEFKGYRHIFEHYLDDVGSAIQWDKIQRLPEGSVDDYRDLKPPSESHTIKNMLNKLVVVKLNGGLGTSMGCKGPKSVIPVRNDLTFLDLTVQQIEHLNKTYNCSVPLVLMNSFNTEEDTQKVLRKYENFDVKIYTFLQSRYPRINKESLLPIAKHVNQDETGEAWYPPGHGDFYPSFSNSGLLEEFISEGREYVFLSNIDNLGATVDLNLVNHIFHKDTEFVMEVTDKTKADVKGGTLIEYENKLRLLEIAQVPKNHVEDFKSVKKFRIFNTNNLWISLQAIKREVDANSINMEVIVNPKTLDCGTNVIQLETAVGSAMKNFNNAQGVLVPRARFLPVKKTSDLLLVMSNLYSLYHGTLIMSPQRMFPTVPLVKLGENHFAKVKEFLDRFGTIPDILELDHITVSGDVKFGKNVSLKGTVIIIANHGDRIDIPNHSDIENKIVTGNLRINDH